MDPNLIISYSSSAGYMSGKSEIQDLLTTLGDQKANQELLAPGIIGVATVLKSRDVIEELREFAANDPESIKCTTKWVPADFWCDANVEAIKSLVKEEIKDLILPEDQYMLEILPHRTSLKPESIIDALRPWLKGKISVERPQKILRIELFDNKASITLLKPKDIFVRE